MTQEEKAKRYDSMFERLKEMYNNNKTNVAARLICERYFPELKESEGERIRKKLVQFFKEKDEEDFEEWVPKAKVLAWLEKQGEHANFINKIQIGDKVTRNEDGVLVNLSQLKRIAKPAEEYNITGIGSKHAEGNLGEMIKNLKPLNEILGQKPADKVEPKFREGDWVVYCNDDVDLITGIEENGYCINNGGYIPFVCENEMRLWDITDAKVGDVLVSESTCGLGTWYCIFKSLDGDESMTVYCYLARDGRFETKKEQCFDKDPYNTKPATKEQRDQLEKAMANAGYTFDFDKKELKKIEGTTAWSEEDEKCIRLSTDIIDSALRAGFCVQLDRDRCVDWLKSLRPQNWKPSEIQLETLKELLHDVPTKRGIIEELLKQLKQL